MKDKLKINYVLFDDLSFSSKDKFQKWFLTNDKKAYKIAKKENPDLDENDFIRDVWQECLTTDGDYVKVFDEICYFSIMDSYWDNKKIKNAHYVIIFNEDQYIKDVIEWFIRGKENEIEIDNTFEAFDKVSIGVAYRGGRGYYIGLHAKELYEDRE